MLEFPPIKDIAPPVEPSAAAVHPWIWWLAAGVLGLVVLAAVGLWFWNLGRQLALPGLPALPQARAVRELAALRQTAPALGAEVFAARLTEILRSFLHRQTGILAHFSTSPEILGDRPRRDLPPPQPAVAAFREVLTAADALKYGPANTDRQVQTNALIDAALTAVQAMAQLPVAPVLPPREPDAPAPPSLPPLPR